MAVPNIFATQSGIIPLAQLDVNFATPVTLGITPLQLGNTVLSITGLTNVGSSTFTGALVGNADTVTNGVYTLGNQIIDGIKTFTSTINGNALSATTAATVVDGVYTVGNQTIGGNKTFNNTILGSISGVTGTFSGAVSGTTGTFSGAVSGTTGTFSGNVQMASANGGQLAGLRNKIINGDMRVAQRGTTFSLTATGAYTVDRWIAVTSVAASGTLTLNVTPVAITEGTSSSSAIRLAKSTGTFAGSLVAGQAFETSNSFGLAGKTVTISFKARKGSSYTGNALPYLVVVTGTGTDQSANNMLAGTWTGYAVSSTTLTGTLTTSMSAFSATATIPASATQVGVQVGLTYATSTTGSANDFLDITDVQLEVGPVATPFEQRPYGMELALCQRYFEVINYASFYVPSTAATAMYTPVYYKVSKRAAPTSIILPSSTNVGFNAAGANITPTTWTTNSNSVDSLSISIGNASLGGHQSGSLTVSSEL